MREAMDVFDLIMEFLIPNCHLPSIFLLKEYIESEFTKKFNTLSTLKYFNKKQDEYHQISEVDYERLRSCFDSRPPIVFYFNPKMQIQEYVKDGYLNIGFKGSKGKRIGAGIWIKFNGCMYQGYFNDDRSHIYGREINREGVIYEGGFNMGLKQGKGEIHYEDGTAEKGRWTKGNKLGHFECNDSNGNLIQKKTYGYGREIRKEEVSETIYKEK